MENTLTHYRAKFLLREYLRYREFVNGSVKIKDCTLSFRITWNKQESSFFFGILESKRKDGFHCSNEKGLNRTVVYEICFGRDRDIEYLNSQTIMRFSLLLWQR